MKAMKELNFRQMALNLYDILTDNLSWSLICELRL